MGYTTTFSGELKFKNDLSNKALGKLKSFLGEDCRDHPEWGRTDLTYIDLELTDDFSGIKWDGSEKTYDLVDKINLLITEMGKEYPEFGLEGELLAQGEDFKDRWMLVMENGEAKHREIKIVGKEVECPHCGEKFILEKKK